jgi:hypothetical protein
MAATNKRASQIREELAGIRELIQSLKQSEEELTHELLSLLDGQEDDDTQPAGVDRHVCIDYTSHLQPSTSDNEQLPWKWNSELQSTMKKVWDIDQFRLNQRAVCNAVLSNRDVLVIMPTGGGKQLIIALFRTLCDDQQAY